MFPVGFVCFTCLQRICFSLFVFRVIIMNLTVRNPQNAHFIKQGHMCILGICSFLSCKLVPVYTENRGGGGAWLNCGNLTSHEGTSNILTYDSKWLSLSRDNSINTHNEMMKLYSVSVVLEHCFYPTQWKVM